MAAAVTVIGFTVWTLRSDAIRDESKDVGNIATVLAEQTSRSLLAIDLVLTEIQDHLRNIGIASADDFRTDLKDKETFGFLRDRLSRFVQANVITLADNQGDVVNLSREWPAPKVNIPIASTFATSPKPLTIKCLSLRRCRAAPQDKK